MFKNVNFIACLYLGSFECCLFSFETCSEVYLVLLLLHLAAFFKRGANFSALCTALNAQLLETESVFSQCYTNTMILTGFICLLWVFSLPLKATSQALPKEHTCVTDYWLNISCSLKIPVTPIRSQNLSYWLEFIFDSYNLTFNCSLQREEEDYSCTFKADIYDVSFASYNFFVVTLCYLENGHKSSSLLESWYFPAQSIKPKPPYALMLQYEQATYNFTWKSGYEDHPYRSSLPIMYQFLYRKDGQREGKTIHPKNEMIQIDDMNLDSGATYTAMVRTGIGKNIDYNGTWSEWSAAVNWSTPNRLENTIQHNEDESSEVGKIAIGMFLMVGLVILLLSVSAARLKIKQIAWVPTPATYFQPLYEHHQGNFQCWALAKYPLQDICVTEEFSTIDKIGEIITTLQDQGEKTDFYPSAQYNTPYVGPTTEAWAPCQTSDTCSETSIPFEEFSLFCEELPNRVDGFIQCLSTACLSGDILSLKDSVVGLEDLEGLQSCTLSEPSININPTPKCFMQDYCTLTDTPTGPVPIFTKDVEHDGNETNE